MLCKTSRSVLDTSLAEVEGSMNYNVRELIMSKRLVIFEILNDIVREETFVYD